MTGNDVATLVEDCRRGKSGAWDRFLERYGRLIWSVALRLGADNAEAEEIFQRTWVAVVEGIDRVEHPERVQSWLIGTARNKTYQLFDEQRRLRRFGSLEAADDRTEPTEFDATQEEDALAHEAGVLAHRAVAELDDRCRELVTLLFLADPPLDYREISRRTGLAVGSIGPVRARCLTRLRALFFEMYQPTAGDDS